MNSNHRNRLIVCSFWWNEVWNLWSQEMMWRWQGRWVVIIFNATFIAYSWLLVLTKNLHLLHIEPFGDWPCITVLFLLQMSSNKTRSSQEHWDVWCGQHSYFHSSCKKVERPMELCMFLCTTIMSDCSEQNTCIERFTVNIEGTVWMTKRWK